MGAVTLDVIEWKTQYPQYAGLTTQQVEFLFQLAELYLENNGFSVVTDEAKRKLMLYLLTAHLAFLNFKDANGNGGNPGMVGHIASASEGSVSVSSGLSGVPFNKAFFFQSQFGMMFWNAAKVYMMGFYRG